MLLAAAAGALAGAQVGYLIGRGAGRALQERARRPRLADGMRRAEELFARYGPAKAIVLARFIPVVRTVLNPVAGALHTPLGTFTLWQVVGGLAWTVGLVLAGYALGSTVPGIDAYLRGDRRHRRRLAASPAPRARAGAPPAPPRPVDDVTRTRRSGSGSGWGRARPRSRPATGTCDLAVESNVCSSVRLSAPG